MVHYSFKSQITGLTWKSSKSWDYSSNADFKYIEQIGINNVDDNGKNIYNTLLIIEVLIIM